VKSSNILILGVTFKENCPDVRNTKVVDVIASLEEFGANVTIFDPWAEEEQVLEEFGYTSTKKIINKKYEAIVLAVAHNEFKELDYSKLTTDSSVIYDVKNVLSSTLKNKSL
jgi:UDP-N-acetyl-D-galactosamine dehydrogenase